MTGYYINVSVKLGYPLRVKTIDLRAFDVHVYTKIILINTVFLICMLLLI